MSDIETNTITCADSLVHLQSFAEKSIHACVTDPPYGLNFMGRDWDNFRRKRNENDAGRQNVFGRTSSTSPAHGAETESKRYQQWCEQWAREVRRVLKPGGHLVAFSGNRTYHRLVCGVEDAGFEVRDRIPAHGPSLGERNWVYGSGFPKALSVEQNISWPQESAEMYDFHQGWKTTLKPAHEPILIARKPFDGSVAENVQEHGTGALNIEPCRIESGERPERDGHVKTDAKNWGDGTISGGSEATGTTTEGRYPSNVVFDETEAERLDRQVGDVDGCSPHTISDSGDRTVLDDGGLGATDDRVEGYEDSGGPSRYFYTSKATKSERTLDGKIENAHPTVKPQDLMEWLVKLVTREDQIVLDPFTGSGTTCKAAKELNRQFIGIEKQADWADVARVRCNLTPENPSVVRPDENQQGLEFYSDDD